jgi:hypothetical protein
MPPPRRMAAAPSAAQAESDRISEALGARLLQGWAMLDAYCPRCDDAAVMAADQAQLLTPELIYAWYSRPALRLESCWPTRLL